MTQEQFEQACGVTLLLLRRQNPEADEPAKRHPGHETRPGHLAWMLVNAILYFAEGRVEKANRWLGFVQGSMAADGYATVEELICANKGREDVEETEAREQYGLALEVEREKVKLLVGAIVEAKPLVEALHQLLADRVFGDHRGPYLTGSERWLEHPTVTAALREAKQ